MTYSINGIAAELAPDPVWLGSFIRCTLGHLNLFQYKCPKCGKTVAFQLCGLPLSGRVDLEGYCDCGWRGFETVSGWFKRGEALRSNWPPTNLGIKVQTIPPGRDFNGRRIVELA